MIDKVALLDPEIGYNGMRFYDFAQAILQILW